MNIQKKQSGFTLVELITVVSMLALLTVFVARELGQSSDDVKLNLAATSLISAVPSAMASFKARNFGNCDGIVKADLVERAVFTDSPWGDPWAAAYVDATRILTITYDITGAADLANAGADLLVLLANNPVFAADPTFATPNIIATYTCT